MAKVNKKGLAITVAMGVTLVLVAVGLFGIINSATPADASSGNGVRNATTVEGSAPTGAPVGTASPADPGVAACEFNDWVGSSATEAEAAAKATGRPYRMLPPGSMMTMDYRADRINVELDSTGDEAKVTKVSCG